MADAGPRRQARHLSQRVSRTDAQGRRAVCAGCLPQRLRVLRFDHSGLGRVRRVFRTVWPEGATRPHRRASGAQAGLLLSLDVRGSGAFAAGHGNASADRRAGYRHRLFNRVAAHFRHG